MNRTLLSATLTAMFAFAAMPALAKDAKPATEKAASPLAPYAKVNGKVIPQARFDAMLTGQKAQGQEDQPALRDAIREELVRREILSQEAARTGMDKKPEIQAQMELARQSVLIGAYLNDHVKKHPIGDEALKAEYEKIRATLGDKEYHSRHILLENEDDAKQAISRLAKGEPFDELAKALSKDPGSKERGGDLGWANPASFVKPFSDAMTKLEKGQYTKEPVKSDFGWHVIRLEETRELKGPSFDEVKPQLTRRMQQQMVEQHILDLRSKAKVE